MKYVIILMCLSASLCSNAQKLSLPDLIGLRTQSAEKITTFLKGKGYTVARDSKDGGQRIIMYRSQVIENNKTVSRIVSVTLYPEPKDIVLHYGLFDKKEADSLVAWLVSNGFTFMGKKLLVAKQMQSTYTKDKKTIFFKEIAYEGEPVLYQFAIFSQHYQ